ncbi:hypothetical protein [Tropicibacter naphthalenivorans]|uniref:hypothetical protein n=1 Tax=Tropicibacter naphthalenivorans TaxID=441103 RepID=UPI001180130C|nr:hypothetical protein [Tropicibacter naphthalenivorans]
MSEEAFNDYWAQRVMASKIYQTSGEKLGYGYPPHPMTKVSMCLSKAHIAQLEAHGYRPQFLFMDRSYREEGTTGRGKRGTTIYAKTVKGPIRIRRTNKNLMACKADDLRVETIDRQPLFKVSGKAGAERDLVAFWGN